MKFNIWRLYNMPKTYAKENVIIGPSITYTPWHPRSFTRGGHIGQLPISANLFPLDEQVNNIIANTMRGESYNESYRRQVINPYN